MQEGHAATTFYLVSLSKPTTIKEYREGNGWLRARIHILDGRFKEVKGNITFEGKLPTCCTSFKFTTQLEQFKPGKFRPTHKKLKPTVEHRDDTTFTRDDLVFVLKEMEGRVERDQIDTLNDLMPISVTELKRHSLFNSLDLSFNAEYFRFHYEAVLRRALPKQRDRIRKLSSKDFQGAYELLMSKPWLMCIGRYTRQFGLKEMLLEDFYTHIKETKKTVAPMMCTVVRLYSYIRSRNDCGDSIFECSAIVSDYLGHYQWGQKAREAGDTLERCNGALDFLTFHGLDWVDEEERKYLAFPRDLFCCTQIMESLDALGGETEYRAGYTPCVPHPDLSETQQDFIKHCMQNKLTLLTGGPGTGKSECLVAVMATFARPLVVTYVGMMVDALQKRFGARTETVHTIHSIYFASKLEDKSFHVWLQQFDVIVIDEFSNVDEHLFSKLLGAVPAPTKLICAGDLGQIYPIKPGCPFRDLIKHFPQHVFELVDNKRVDPDALALANASSAVNKNRLDLVEFGGALKMSPYSDEILEDAVRGYMTHGLMQFQVVVLINKERKRLNTLIEDILCKYGLIRKNRSRHVVTIFGKEGQMELFTGKKIAFCANVKVDKAMGDGVRNGEIGQIENIRILKGNRYELLLHNGKRVILGTSAVPMEEVCAGYATTCNKAQGSEWLHTIFSIHARPSRFFTAEFVYVAISRAKRGCTILGKREDLAFLCAKRATPRVTLLDHFLSIRTLEGVTELVDYKETLLPDYQHMELLDESIPAVPCRPDPTQNKKTKRRKTSFR